MSDEYVRVFCSGQIRKLPRTIWNALQGPKPPRPAFYINNGCTLSPDWISHKETWPACVLHDYAYSAESPLDRALADALLRQNIVTCLKAEGLFGWAAEIIAFFYWRAVRKLGRNCYSGTGDPN